MALASMSATSSLRLFTVLGLCLLAACPAAIGDSMAASLGNPLRRVDSVTEFFGFGGIQIATNHTGVDVGPDRYAIVADTRSSGLAEIFIDLATHSEASGIIVQDRLQPRFYRGEVHRNGTDSYTRVEHRDDGSVVAAANPPGIGARPDLAVIAGTSDQMTAFLSVERQVAIGRPCTGDLRVFDGRHLYTLHFRDLGSEPLQLARAAGFAASLRRCRMVREAISGFADAAGRSEGVSAAAISYATLADDALAIPLRMDLETEFGSVAARLVKLQLNGLERRLPE